MILKLQKGHILLKSIFQITEIFCKKIFELNKKITNKHFFPPTIATSMKIGDKEIENKKRKKILDLIFQLFEN